MPGKFSTKTSDVPLLSPSSQKRKHLYFQLSQTTRKSSWGESARPFANAKFCINTVVRPVLGSWFSNRPCGRASSTSKCHECNEYAFDASVK